MSAELPQQGRLPETKDGAWFTTTHWGVVLNARSDSPESSDALSKLCHAYWHPLYWFIRRSGYKPEDAQDLTQDFFASLLEKNYLDAVVREKGKFRSFLLMALKRFLANQRDHANRLKRGGGHAIISLDAQNTENHYLAEPMDTMTPEKAFERRWALALLEQVMAALQAEFCAEGKADLFEALKGFLSGDRESYAEISQKLGMSQATLRVNVHRLRHRYRELLRREIAHTVERPEDIEEEILYLFSALSS